MSAERCSDCGTTLGEIHRVVVSDVWLCRRCYLRRPEPEIQLDAPLALKFLYVKGERLAHVARVAAEAARARRAYDVVARDLLLENELACAPPLPRAKVIAVIAEAFRGHRAA
jgi:recombinational DNA repair protein (RecF pathway)